MVRFSLIPPLPFLNLYHSHCRRILASKHSAICALCERVWNLRTAGAETLYRLCHEASFCQIRDWRFCNGVESLVVTKNEELSDNYQEDVVDSTSVDVYCSRGANAHHTLEDKDAGCADGAGGGTWFDKYWCLYWHGLVRRLKTMVFVMVCIGASFGLYLCLRLNWHVLKLQVCICSVLARISILHLPNIIVIHPDTGQGWYVLECNMFPQY